MPPRRPSFALFNGVFLLMSCRTSLYILDISPLTNIYIVNIFTSSMSCLFSWCAEVFNFDEVQFINIFFSVPVFSVLFLKEKKNLAFSKLWRYCFMCYLKSFIDNSFYVWVCVTSQINRIIWHKVCVELHFLCADTQLLQHHLWEHLHYPSSYYGTFVFFHIYVGPLLDLLFYFIDLYVYLFDNIKFPWLH